MNNLDVMSSPQSQTSPAFQTDRVLQQDISETQGQSIEPPPKSPQNVRIPCSEVVKVSISELWIIFLFLTLCVSVRQLVSDLNLLRKISGFRLSGPGTGSARAQLTLSSQKLPRSSSGSVRPQNYWVNRLYRCPRNLEDIFEDEVGAPVILLRRITHGCC